MYVSLKETIKTECNNINYSIILPFIKYTFRYSKYFAIFTKLKQFIEMKKIALIVAGGSGTRMEADIPKQFMLLNNKPVLMHTIERFYKYDSKLPIIVVLPENEIKNWNELVNKYFFGVEHIVVTGGRDRFQSVRNGLEMVTDRCILSIHDGVRPLCSTNLIMRCFDEAEKYSSAVPAIKISESIREIKNGKNFSVNRDHLRIIQTPQCFDSILLKQSYENVARKNLVTIFTDDASVFEQDGNSINLIEGERNNIKITLKEDLIIASEIEKASSS